MKNKKSTNRIETFIINKLRKHCIEIIIGQRKSFNIKPIMQTAKKIYFQYNEDKFERTVSYYYMKEKERLRFMLRRIDHNEEIQKINEKYKLIDVFMLVKYLALHDKFKLQSKKDIMLIEDICKINYKIPLFNINENYIEKIENEEEHTLKILTRTEQKKYLERLEKKQNKNISKYTYD